MFAAFHFGKDPGNSDKPSFKNPGVVKGACQSLANAGKYRFSLLQKIKEKLGDHSSQKIHLVVASKEKER